MTTTTQTQTPVSTDTGFLRSLLWATVTIAGATMMLAVLWTRAS